MARPKGSKNKVDKKEVDEIVVTEGLDVAPQEPVNFWEKHPEYDPQIPLNKQRWIF
jgi:hypothetical protein